MYNFFALAIGKKLLANSENLTPQPPSLVGKGEPESPSPRWGGVGEGSDFQLIDQQYLGNRGYKNKVRLRGLLKPAQAGLVCVAAVSNRQAQNQSYTN